MSANPFLFNPQLQGEPFHLEADGDTGVVLFHGFTATSAEVRALGEYLHRAGYSTAGPLLPGHGTTPDDLNRVTWHDWTAAAEQAYHDMAARKRRVFVGGESNGGLAALWLAQRHPEIAGVLAYSPALRLPLTPFQRLQARAAALFLASVPKSDLSGTTWQGYRVNPLKGLFQLMRFQKAVEANLAQIRQPILIVQGRHDRTIDPRSSQIVCDRVSSPVKRLVWMENSGHCVLLDPEAEEVQRLTAAFLREVSGGD